MATLLSALLPPLDANGNTLPMPATYVARFVAWTDGLVTATAPEGSGTVTMRSPSGDVYVSGTSPVTAELPAGVVVLSITAPQPGFAVVEETVAAPAVVNVVTDYGADPTGATDSTAAIQAAVNAAGSAILLLPPGLYTWSDTISVGTDLTVYAYGATLRWTGTTAVSGWVNTAPINLRWFGGTIDGNSSNQATLWGFGATGVTPASDQLLSCVAEDIEFVNLEAGGWTCQYISSTGTDANEHIRWRNLKGVKSATNGNSDDIFEVVGYDVECDVVCESGATGAFGITSAFLKHARISCYTQDAGGLPASNSATLLQAFSSNGPAPWFEDVEIIANGNNQLANGNLTAATTVSSGPIRYLLRQASSLLIGSSAYDVWDRVYVAGDMALPFGGAINIYKVDAVTIDDVHITLDETTSTQAAAINFAASASIGEVVINGLTVVAAASTLTGIVNKGTGSTVTSLVMNGGNLTQANLSTNPLFAGTGTIDAVAVRNVQGYNPLTVTTPAVPAASTAVENTTGVDVDVYVGGAGVGVAVSIDGVASGLSAGTFYLPAGGTINLGPYTTAPTWVWIGR